MNKERVTFILIAGKVLDQLIAMPPTSPPTDKKTCTNCGNPFSDDSVFCKKCGARLTEQQNVPNVSSQNIGITTLSGVMFRANPRHTGEYGNCDIDPPNILLWRFATGGGVGSSPAVSNGIVYVGSDDKNLYAIDAVTGKEKWRFATGSFVVSSPAVSNGIVYVGSDDKNLYAIDAVTGTEKWRIATGNKVISPPAVVNGVVYFGSNDKNLYAIDAVTGMEKWRIATGNNVISSPAVANGIIYVGSGDKHLHAIDAVTGKEKWRFATGNSVGSSPAVVNGVVYVGSIDNNVYAIDAVTGKEKWRFPTKDRVGSSPAVANGVVFVGSRDKNLYAIGEDEVVHRQQTRITELKEKANKLLVETERLVQVPTSIKTDLQAHDEHTFERAFKELKSLRANTKPVLTFTFDHTNLIANHWHKIGVPISNTGNSPAFDVTLSFPEEFEIKRVRPIIVEAKKSETVEVAIRSNTDGTIPFEITIDYQDVIGTKFKETQVFWVDVIEKSTTTSPPSETPSSSVGKSTSIPLNEGTITQKNETRPQIVYNVVGNVHIGNLAQTEIKDIGLIKESTFGTEIPLGKKVCQICHQTIHDNEKFCTNCGQDLKE